MFYRTSGFNSRNRKSYFGKTFSISKNKELHDPGIGIRCSMMTIMVIMEHLVQNLGIEKVISEYLPRIRETRNSTILDIENYFLHKMCLKITITQIIVKKNKGRGKSEGREVLKEDWKRKPKFIDINF